MKTVEETLTRQYGPLLSITQLATLLIAPGRLAHHASIFGRVGQQNQRNRLRLGRRVYFRTTEVVDVLGIR